MPGTITAHPYVEVRVLASRQKGCDAHGEPCKGKIVFFQSMEKYHELYEKYNWGNTQKFDHTWCDKPQEISVLVTEGDYRRFKAGEHLYERDVAMKLSQLEILHSLD